MKNEKEQQQCEPTVEEIIEFLESSSDFSFEMAVLHQINRLGFQCSHAGTYSDPITSKVRQYDIRALKQNKNHCLHLSIECKNLSEAAPLLVHTTSRSSSESYHYLFFRSKDMMVASPRLEEASTLYPDGRAVGKKLDLLRRDQNGKLKGKDEEVFERLNQAQNSAYHLIQAGAMSTQSDLIQGVVPILVIPDDTLWCVDYSVLGDRSYPQRAKEVSFFIGQEVPLLGPYHTGQSFHLSHIEIVTFSWIARRISSLMELISIGD